MSLPGRTCYVDLLEVGGSARYADSRFIFYSDYHGVDANVDDIIVDGCAGIVLVHDSSNRRSYEHLRDWLDELARGDPLR